MNGLYFLAPMLVTILASMLIVRAGATALLMTGMSYEKAKFQALSAFSGTGFTTREAERVVNHPMRRRIVSWLMILGNAGIVTVIVTASASFAQAKGFELGINAIVLIAGLAVLYFIGVWTNLAHRWEAFVRNWLLRNPNFDEDPTVDELLHLFEGYGVASLRVSDGSPLAGKAVDEARPLASHCVILGVERDGRWIPSPDMESAIWVGDKLVLYAKLDDLAHQFS
ncbi:MAG: TrkA C-terminal domain-containing protein [Pseudomonadales bacterium]|nr:TrkA C-terminal domain-containing protein [Pseudomonadales bacterium]